RPRQWTKNLLVFIGLIFALRLAYPDLVARATLACIAFCVLSSAGYLVNDVADAAADRLHPVKRLRPVASGALSAPAALALAALLALGGMALAFSLGTGFAAVALPVPISPWLYVCTGLAALFIALSKRRGELVLLSDSAPGHRRNLELYTEGLLDQLIVVVLA